MKVRNSFKYQKLKEFTISRVQKKKNLNSILQAE